MVQLIFRLIAALPLGAVQRIGAVIGCLVYWVSADYRRRLRDNLAAAGYRDRRLIASAAREAGKQAMEIPWVFMRPRSESAATAKFVEPVLFDTALADDRPVLLLAPHLGCFEVFPQFYAMTRPASKRQPMTVLYRVPRKSMLRSVAERGRAAEGLIWAPAEMRGVKMIIKAMQQRQVVGMLPDQVPLHGEGVWAPFFGREAYTMTLPARLALQFDAIVLFLYGERLADGAGFQIHLRPLQRKFTGDARTDAAIINTELEALIRTCPHQYLWAYNRYKVPPGVEPPAAKAAQ